MEDDIILLVRQGIKQELQNKLKCYIKIKYYNDTFYIDLQHNYKTVFKCSVIDVPCKISSNFTSKAIENDVLIAFKKHLLSKYFK